MEKPIKPKLPLKPALALALHEPSKPKIGVVARPPRKQALEGDTHELNHMATLSGLGLLVHIAEVGEHLSNVPKTIVGNSDAKAVDPRNRVDPRKRFIPR